MNKNKIVVLRTNNLILRILGQFRTNWQAKGFILENYPDFRQETCQWSKLDSPEFITIE